jgi:hypothetical protein
LRKIVTILFAVGLVFSLLISSVWAVEVNQDVDMIQITQEEKVEESEEESVMTPESPFYFLKRFMENVRLVLTFDQEKRVTFLDALVEERARELDALENMYETEEMSEAELKTLENALDELVLFAERLMSEVSKLEEGDGEPETTEEGVEPEDELGEIEDGELDGETLEQDKYEWRIAHLQAIAEKAPAPAQNGLARAIANAERQRERAIAKGKLPGDEELVEDEDEDELESVITEELIDEQAEIEEVDSKDVKVKLEKDEKQKKEKKQAPGGNRPQSVPGNGYGLQKR